MSVELWSGLLFGFIVLFFMILGRKKDGDNV